VTTTDRSLRIGLVFETQGDAEAELARRGNPQANLSHYYHWREPFELDAVTHAIERLGHRVLRVGSPQQMARRLEHWTTELDFVFNLSVGFIDRFRLSAGPLLFELAGLPYSGADPYTKMISQNKHLLKSQFEQLGIPTPSFVVATPGRHPSPVDLPPFPLIVKPVTEGSSVGVWADSVVHDERGLRRVLDRLWATLGMDALIESFIAGREIKVVLLGDREPVFEGIIEDVDDEGLPLGDRILHFDDKSTGVRHKRAVAATEPPMPAILADCRRIYRRFLPVDYASFDLRIDDSGQHHFLEFQADATLHPDRTLARCCELNGLEYETAVQTILQTALDRWGL